MMSVDQVLTTDQLRNAHVWLGEDGRTEDGASGLLLSVQLQDGTSTNDPFPGSDVSLAEPVASGDLDGDGVDDAAVILTWRAGGNGLSFYLAAMLNRGGQPVEVSWVPLGERPRIQSLAIADQTIILDRLTGILGPSPCGFDVLLHEEYRLNNGVLTRTVAGACDAGPPLAVPVDR